jgi:bacterioferritin (cytochrome b1)
MMESTTTNTGAGFEPETAPSSPEDDGAALDKVLSSLNQIFSERYHSIAQQILVAEPNMKAGDEVLLEDVRQVAQFDKAEAERLIHVIDELGGVPKAQPFSPEISEMNYVSIDHLHALLCASLRRELDRCEVFIAEAEAIPKAKQVLVFLSKGLEEHVSKLRQTRQAPPSQPLQPSA